MLYENPSRELDFLSGGGLMGGLIRSHDWAATSIGSPASWPQPLRISISLMLNSRFPVIIWWGTELIQFYNDACIDRLTAENHSYFLGKSGHDNTTNHWPVLYEQIKHLIGGGEPTWHEDEVVAVERMGHAEDTAYWTYSLTRIADGGGAGGVLGICRDVTREHLAVLALREREAELARVQAIGRVGGIEIHLVGGVRIRRSPEYLQVHGLPPDAAEVEPGKWLSLLHPDDQNSAQEIFRKILNSGASEYHAQYRIVRPSDGAIRWISVKLAIERNATGRAVRLVGAHMDVTDQVEIEQALRSSEEEARQLAARLINLNDTLELRVQEKTRERDRIWNVSRDLLLVVQPDGVLRSVNPAWFLALGWNEDELLGRTTDWLEHPDDGPRFRQTIAKLSTGHAVVRFENRFRDVDGSYRWLSWTAVPDQDLIYAVARDVTADKVALGRLTATEEALRQAQKLEAVGQLTGGIAHDFNNILTSIVGALDLLKLKISRGHTTDAGRYINAAMTSVNRAAALTHRLLAFARLQPLSPKPVNANTLIKSLEDLLRRTIGPNLILGFDAGSDLWLTLCDSNQLESALLNLTINARDAMPDGGRLSISTSNERIACGHPGLGDLTAGDYVCITVTDTGKGMSPEVMARACDPFFTTKPSEQGTGLGLSMIYGFARQSHGQLVLQSTPGSGTSVRIYLPHYDGAVEPDAPVQARPDAAATGEHLLVVEDEPLVREILIENLMELGYCVSEAGDGEAALRILRQERRVDLLITDIGMPGMNGRELADHARELMPDLNVLFMTGYAEGAAFSRKSLAPGMELVTKPFDVQNLHERIRKLLR